jgi:glycosyltransferase involved in cell wall biosynthesis
VRVLIDYRPALRERTGVGEYTHELVKALVRAIDSGTLDLTVFSSSWKDRLRLDEPALNGIHVVDRRVPVRLLNLAWHRLGWPPVERLAGRAFDVTHSLHPLLLPSRAAAQVITIHDLSFLESPDPSRADVRRHYPALVHLHARRADRIIVPSQYVAGEVARRLNVPPEKIAPCHPGAPDWPARTSLPTSGYVLFVGTLEPRKNVGALLDAYEQLLSRPANRLRQGPGGQEAGLYENPGAGRYGDPVAGRGGLPELVLAGKATPSSRPWLERIERPPLRGVVRHLGYVHAEHRRDLYAGARLLVLPSFDEGFGLPVLEAMAMGVPVVAANRGALPEVIGTAGLLINPDDPEELAAAIEHLLTDEAFAAECVSRGLARAREFRWDAMAERVVDVYRAAIEHRRCASA